MAASSSSITIGTISEAEALNKQITFAQSTHDQVATNSFAIAVLKLRKRYLSRFTPNEMNKRFDDFIYRLGQKSKFGEDKKEEKTEKKAQSASSAAIQYIIKVATKDDVHKHHDYVRNQRTLIRFIISYLKRSNRYFSVMWALAMAQLYVYARWTS